MWPLWWPIWMLALCFWRDALGLELSHIEDVPSQKSQVAFLPLGDSEVELVKPTSDDSGVAKFLAERGPAACITCALRSTISTAMLAQLKAKGSRLINETPGPAGRAQTGLCASQERQWSDGGAVRAQVA
jgi:hypothetical protein